jgi:hypothetical protein
VRLPISPHPHLFFSVAKVDNVLKFTRLMPKKIIRQKANPAIALWDFPKQKEFCQLFIFMNVVFLPFSTFILLNFFLITLLNISDNL